MIDGYQAIPESRVPGWVIISTKKAVEEASRLLRIKTPSIQWWLRSPTATHKMAAWVEYPDPDAVHFCLEGILDVCRDGREIRALAFHEVHHVYQWESGRFTTKKEDEERARRWAYQQTGITLWGLKEPWEY
jgi:hypothetical protein